MTNERKARLRKRLREVQLKYPDTCYLLRDNDGHYRISGLSGDAKGNVTAEIVHSRDSYFPGVLVFGIDPADLIVCGCGKWELPEKDQETQSVLTIH